MTSGQDKFKLALQQVVRIVHAIAHFQVVFQRHLLDRPRVRQAFGLERCERACEAVRISDMSRKRNAILERAVHALPVEGHHRVRGIADQHGIASQVPAL